MFIETYIIEMLAEFAKSGTLSRTGEKLSVSQPAITKAMKKLEHQLGVTLFERTKNKITLNASGKIAAEYAEQIMKIQGEMIQKTQESAGVHRLFSIGSIAIQPAVELARIVDTLYAGINVQYTVGDNEDNLIAGLETGKYQMIVLLHPLSSYKLHNQKYFTEHLYAMLPQSHPLSKEKSIHLSDLKGEQLALHSNVGFWEKLLQEKIPSSKWIRLVHDDDSNDPVAAIIKATDIVSFISDRTIWFSLPKNRVKIPISDPCVNVTFWAICKEEKCGVYKEMLAAVSKESK